MKPTEHSRKIVDRILKTLRLPPATARKLKRHLLAVREMRRQGKLRVQVAKDR